MFKQYVVMSIYIVSPGSRFFVNHLKTFLGKGRFLGMSPCPEMSIYCTVIIVLLDSTSGARLGRGGRETQEIAQFTCSRR